MCVIVLAHGANQIVEATNKRQRNWKTTEGTREQTRLKKIEWERIMVKKRTNSSQTKGKKKNIIEVRLRNWQLGDK